ncbi:protein of unknown function DUF1501 [Pirellula staleyi DSM 6068]|uniref:DUF1501 domain-containing protein n=1 Tax=Pirellula staleyi (strain ATCC 27377 / DSM 6068 / ICPB 4128) TaxID=530564 RepID=D2QYI4_PIRSD|nr:DUF1501 domain-containing protein [Pirellula staleyi]ADB18143.1 protein of unknown function DUF1501 [Pirellula staleyi DSM 6068]
MHCHSPEHLSRRALLKGTLLSAAGGVVMNWGGLTTQRAFAEEVARQGKHCIYLFMNGGVSQFETFDMKPGRPTGGLFRPRSTNVAGTQICELMPKMAQKMDKIAVIRSMRTSEVDHPGGIYLMHTGYRPAATVRFPEIGAIVAKYQGKAGADLPSFIKVSSVGDAGAGFLGPKYLPFSVGSEGGLPPFSTSSLDPQVEQRRHELRSFVEDRFAAEHRVDVAKMHREAYEAARRLQGVKEVFRIDEEWEKYRDLYGDSQFGRRCLLARKLVEQGVAFIEVGQSSYDSHADNFAWHKGLVPPMEHAWAGLLTDLEQRGLLEKTLIIWAGEIGRTPSINNRAGRDHYVRSWSTALAGCGIKGGMLYGESDEDGEDVKDKPVTEGDFFATIYHALGIDPTAENFAGVRPVPLAPFGSKVVTELFG